MKVLALTLGILMATSAVQAAEKNARKPVKIAAPVAEEASAPEEDSGYEEAAPRPRQKQYSEYGSQGRTSRGQVGLELLGAALLYSFSGSYLVTDQIALNAGLSYFTLSSSSTGLTYKASVGVTQIPLSVSFLFGGPDHHFEVLGGGDLLFASASVSGNGVADRATGSGFIPEIGAGYRYWPAAGGFHFRATMYGLAIPSNFAIWPGFSFGYAF